MKAYLIDHVHYNDLRGIIYPLIIYQCNTQQVLSQQSKLSYGSHDAFSIIL